MPVLKKTPNQTTGNSTNVVKLNIKNAFGEARCLNHPSTQNRHRGRREGGVGGLSPTTFILQCCFLLNLSPLPSHFVSHTKTYPTQLPRPPSFKRTPRPLYLCHLIAMASSSILFSVQTHKSLRDSSFKVITVGHQSKLVAIPLVFLS